jgi:hypothetical protein
MPFSSRSTWANSAQWYDTVRTKSRRSASVGSRFQPLTSSPEGKGNVHLDQNPHGIRADPSGTESTSRHYISRRMLEGLLT